MSQLSELLEKNKSEYLSARLEATALVLEELVKLLSAEQREKLDEAIIARCPTVKDASADNPCTAGYQLLQFVSKGIGSND
ncbi:hypothetical protein EHB58_09625 [Salmonella enterica subsp. enterica serovar Hull]|uniref:Uncharacterized protein n=1 Tax=Salmonella enterica subsp. enterica serovar Hull TaxID=1403564 RepID=A0A5X4PEA9_SALET|nr:hypothetical protein [Salmonella enterica]EBZ7585884.1 hypothetical protein [Salmonella enterica subsp. enterica serovar Hull]ECC8734516.1 hypothetical protein [Salmonella bongori]ECF2938640.1 hypothetical protein [Salmonella enterica subsp. enterica serovar Reading]ECN6005619.1 hypothetical protein [Salmonella enterica subsp. enterica serovar Brandenburg]